MKRPQIISRGVLLLSLLLIGSPLFAEKTERRKPAKPIGPLTELEQKLQGTWKIGYTIIIGGREFCADTQPGEWYEGYIVIRTDTEPAQIDFVIEDCPGCEFEGPTSEGIFYLDDGIVVAHNPPPGNPRPKDFESKDPVRLRFERGRESAYPATHCLGEKAADSDD